MDLVSIITPTWNCGRFIAETIRSVQAQTYTNWELLIVDDCSSDNTETIVNRFIAEDNRIKYFRNNSNSGAAVSRNFALQQAQGRWIAFLDSDDLWMPKKLERQIRFMQNNDYAFSYHKYSEIDEQSSDLGVTVSGIKHINRKRQFDYCWQGCLTVMYDQMAVGLIQIADIKKNNDYAIWLQVIRKADCYLLDECMAKYRRRTGSISNHGYTALLKWHYKLFREAENQNAILSAINTCRNIFWGIVKKTLYITK